MKNLIVLMLVPFLISCSKMEKGAVLEKDSKDYELAMKLSEKVNDFNPEINKVIATTSSFEITAGDIVERIRANFGSRAESLTSRSADDLKKLMSEFASNIAIAKITLLEAENEGIVISDSLVENIIEKQVNRMGGKEKYIEFLAQNGSNEENIRRDVKIQEINRAYMNEKRKELSVVSDEEVDKAMQGDRLATVRHILLLTQGKSETEKKEIYSKMEEILAEAKSGKDFEELAKTHSEDPGSKANGGLYKDFGRGRMVPSFEEASFNVPIGEISDIVETSYGYHILKVIERKKEDRTTDQVKKELQRNKQKTVIYTLYEDLKKEYDFQMNDIS